MTSLDISEVVRLADDLRRAPEQALRDIDEIVKKSADDIKQTLIDGARWSEHFRGMARSITYESHYLVGQVRYVIGPDKARRGGALGNIFYFGTSRGGGTGDLEGSLASEGPRLQRSLAEAAQRWVRVAP